MAMGRNWSNLISKEEVKEYVNCYSILEADEEMEVIFYNDNFKSEDQAAQEASRRAQNNGPAAAVSYFGLPKERKKTKNSEKLSRIDTETIPNIKKMAQTIAYKSSEGLKSSPEELIKCKKM